jgi:sugar phosphate isomerase/epimerase
VAAHLGIKTVAGFPGAVIELESHPKGQNPVYKPFENFLPQLLAFWEPIARIAADKGVRIAFEHCPMAPYHLPIMGFNMLAQPAMWERLFNESKCHNLGIEWDASHLVCQFIDPVANVHKFGSRIFHVHAKDAFINRQLLEVYGICHPGVAEHRFPGLGQSNWAEIIHALLRAGYDSDLNIEGWHDPVYRDHTAAPPIDIQLAQTHRQAGQKLEEAGLLIAKRTLEQYVPVEPSQ